MLTITLWYNLGTYASPPLALFFSRDNATNKDTLPVNRTLTAVDSVPRAPDLSLAGVRLVIPDHGSGLCCVRFLL
jgi:hypothetical protein